MTLGVPRLPDSRRQCRRSSVAPQRLTEQRPTQDQKLSDRRDDRNEARNRVADRSGTSGHRRCRTDHTEQPEAGDGECGAAATDETDHQREHRDCREDPEQQRLFVLRAEGSDGEVLQRYRHEVDRLVTDGEDRRREVTEHADEQLSDSQPESAGEQTAQRPCEPLLRRYRRRRGHGRRERGVEISVRCVHATGSSPNLRWITAATRTLAEWLTGGRIRVSRSSWLFVLACRLARQPTERRRFQTRLPTAIGVSVG